MNHLAQTWPYIVGGLTFPTAAAILAHAYFVGDWRPSRRVTRNFQLSGAVLMIGAVICWLFVFGVL
jgi:hypothetical protein